MAKLGKASVQYGDMRGTAAIDFHEGTELHALAAHIGATGFPIALEIRPLGMDHQTEERFLKVVVYTTAVGGADSLQKHADEHNNKLTAKQFSGRLSLEELSRFVKRFEIVLQSKLIPNAEIHYESADE